MKYLILASLFLIASPALAITCPEGQISQSVITSPAVPLVPAVTHIVSHEAVTHIVTHEASTHIVHHDAVTHIVHHDAVTHIVTHPAITHDVVVVDTPAYTSCDYVGHNNGDYTNFSCTNHGSNWNEVYKKVNHPAVTHTETIIDTPAWDEVVVDVPAYDETVIDVAAYDEVVVDTAPWDEVVVDSPAYDEVVIDTPEVPGTPATYEDQCVVNPDYTPPVPVVPVVIPRGAGGPPPCIMNGTCPCFGLMGNFLDACIVQKYPNKMLCELAPVQTCFGMKNCTPEPFRCVVPTTPTEQIHNAIFSGMSLPELTQLIIKLFGN
jgi:hypothetical protein